MKRIAIVGLALAAAALAAIAVACSDQQIQSCHAIPAGGCPLAGNGAECQDPSCAAAYGCDETTGTWIFDHACPAQDGGNVQDASTDADAGKDANFDANIDAPPGAFGGPGCVTLQPPDCPLGEALICSAGCCGCSDLWVCNDGGWDPWGTCSDDAGIVPQ